MSAVAKGLDMAVAFYLEAHGNLSLRGVWLWLIDFLVQHGYIYLMNNYRPGDRICLVIPNISLPPRYAAS